MVQPWLIAQAVIAWKNRAIVVHLQFATPRGSVSVLVDVVDSVGGRAFIEIRCASEKIDARFLWEGKNC